MPEEIASSHTTDARGVILIVDDQLKNVQLVGGLLTREGYEVIPATSGEQALQRIAARVPDLVLLDVVMPVMTGFEVCRQIGEMYGSSAPPVIFLSAADEKDIIVQALESGGVDYVTKPFNRAELLARVRTHIELKLARDTVTRTMREKDELMSMVAHDLKNPLGAVRFSAMTLAESGTISSKTGQEMVGHIVSTSDEMLAFIERFLIRKAKESDPVSLTSLPVDVFSICDECGTWVSMAKRKNITLTITPPAARMLMLTDRKVFCQVLDNLISNAVKFTPPGGKVALQIEVIDGHLHWHVDDSGPGFTEADLPKLFQDYTRLSAQPTGGESSTGLGLAIAKRLSDRLNSVLAAGKSPLGGARFTLRLPLHS